MSFWQWGFLFGTAAFSIPVVIHLIFHIRKRRVVFSSLRFLQHAVLQKKQRLRLRDLLLLLLRCAACILIALAFARPFRPGSVFAGADGKAREDVVIVFDDSPSGLAQEGSAPRWEKLAARASAEIARLNGGDDRVGVVLASDPKRAAVELGLGFKAAAGCLKPSARRGNLSDALNTAIGMLASSTMPQRRIVVCTDLQSNQIDRNAWMESAQNASAVGRGIVAQVETPDGGAPARLANLAVTEVKPKSDVWIENHPVTFAVRVANHGDGEVPNLTARLVVNGQVLASRSIGLGPRSSSEFELAGVFPRPGEFSGQVEIEAHDPLPEDDARCFALNLRNSLKALVIEDRLGERNSFLDEGYFVRMALGLKARGEDAPGLSGGLDASYVRVDSREVSKTTAEAYAQADVIVAVGIASMSDAELRLLEDAVRGGKNLILFAGRSDGLLNDPFYNGAFWKGGLGLLPARPGPLFEGNRAEGKFHRIGAFKAGHTLFKKFSEQNEAYLRMPVYLKHYQANPADLKTGSEVSDTGKGGSRPAGEVLAHFTDGSPMVMERPFGKGAVLMFNFAPRPEATDLPRRAAFVPLLHQAVRHFESVAAVSNRNLLAGDAIDFAEAGIAPDTAVSLLRMGAAKDVWALKGGDHPVVEAAGIYQASFEKMGKDRARFVEHAMWAVNRDPLESDLSVEDLDALRGMFASGASAASATRDAVQEWTDERKAQAPDWRWFLAAAAACLFLEVCLRDFTNRRQR
jgi:hypothetical protein